MKILYVCNRFEPAIGGVETHVLNLCNHLEKMGHKISVVCSDFIEIKSSKRFVNNQLSGKINDNITFKRLKSFKIGHIDATTVIPKLPLYLLNNIKKNDVIHVHSYGYFISWITILLAKILRKKIAYTPHYAEETVLPIIIKKVYDLLFAGWSFRLADAVISLTEVERKQLIKKFSLNPKKVHVIPNGINVLRKEETAISEKFRTKNLSKFGINPKNKNIIVVARIAKNKGHIHLLKAMTKLKSCNLIIIGKDWGEKKNLIDFARKNKLDNIHILENITDLEKNNLLKSSDVFVLPSIGGEAFGIVLLEAMLNGLPVVASNVGGISTIVENGKNGYLVDAYSSDQIAEKIELILSFDKLKMENIREYCQKYALKYDWTIICQKIVKLYEKTFL